MNKIKNLTVAAIVAVTSLACVDENEAFKRRHEEKKARHLVQMREEAMAEPTFADSLAILKGKYGEADRAIIRIADAMDDHGCAKRPACQERVLKQILALAMVKIGIDKMVVDAENGVTPMKKAIDEMNDTKKVVADVERHFLANKSKWLDQLHR